MEGILGKGGEGREIEDARLTVCWFDGRMFKEGEMGAGGGETCDCPLLWLEACREAARIWGDGGTEFRSGIFTGGFP